ncbi:MAG: hypoxanthine phosphoribosyltransferase [Elusimicrobia bacterium]|nr:hypoxanthine phosphoribosyltransferase [Elusimicrobiota bacterium]
MHPNVSRALLTEDQIRERIRELGAQISRDYAGRNLTLVCILKGSVIFMSDLMRELTLPCTVDFMRLSSYAGKESTGVVRVMLDLGETAEGRDILVVEDIIDTGLTLSYLMQNLKTRNPRSLEICAFLDKPECRKVQVRAKYVGFQIPNEFVVGYGLDYNEEYRNLPYVGILKPPQA